MISRLDQSLPAALYRALTLTYGKRPSRTSVRSVFAGLAVACLISLGMAPAGVKAAEGPAGKSAPPGKGSGKPGSSGATSATKAVKKAGGRPDGTSKKSAPRKPAKKAAKKSAITEEAPPPGFEKLLRKQRALVDVIHAGRRVGQTFAQYKPGSIRFEKPKDVLKMIGVRRANRKRVTLALAVWMPANVGRVCDARGRPKGCGKLEPKVAGVIFDSARLRVSVFVNPKFLEAAGLYGDRFLRAPDGGLSLIAHLDSAFSGQQSGSNSAFGANLRNLTLLSWREFRARSLVNLSPTLGYQQETLTLEADKWGYEGKLGLFRSTGSFLLNEAVLYGGRIGSSTNTRVDLDQAFGSQIAVFLREDSVVEVLREGRVVSARFYRAGNRLIDTGPLPSGSYPVVLRIRSASGAVREERRFFTKSTAIPPKDQPYIYAEGGTVGRLRDSGFPQRSSLPFGAINGRFRIRDDLALGARALTVGKEHAGEASVFFLSSYLRVELSGVGTSKGYWAAGLSMSGTYKDFSASVSARYLRGPEERVRDPSSPGTFHFIGQRLLQVSGTASYRLDNRTDFFFTASVADTLGNVLDWSLGVRATYAIYRKKGHFLGLEGSAAVTNEQQQFTLRVVYRWQRRQYAASVSAGARAERAAGRTRIDDTSTLAGIYSFQDVYQHDGQVRADFARQRGINQAGVSGRTYGRYGRYSAGARYTAGASGRTLSYSGNGSVGVAVDKRGVVVGGRRRSRSAVILRIRGADPATRFRILVDGQPRRVVKGNATVSLFLPAYKQYAISVRQVVDNKSRSIAEIDPSPRRVVLFPGTARTMTWKARRIVVVFGRILNDAGLPITDAEVKGVNGVAETDSTGTFQAELAHDTKKLTIVKGSQRCDVAIRKLPARKGFVSLGNLTCR